MEIVRFPFFIKGYTMNLKDYNNEQKNFEKTGKEITVKVGDVIFSKSNFNVIAGPCSIESEEHIFEAASDIKKAKVDILRGGAFKLRTSPYDFQGLGEKALKYLVAAGKKEHIPVVSEIIDVRHIDLYSDLDMIQVGARNMKNYSLLKELGRSKMPILLKRGMDATYSEFLYAAEYIMSLGNNNVVLCERGIRTFERYTRNTLDITAVPVLKSMTDLPVIVDPSHSTGRSELVMPVSLAAAAAGANGLIIEIHRKPEEAFSDKEQAITPDTLSKIINKTNRIIEALGSD